MPRFEKQVAEDRDAGVGAVARAVRIEGTAARGIGAVLRRVRDRAGQRADPRKEQLRVAHDRLDLEGRETEPFEIARVAQIGKDEDRSKGGEQEPEHASRVMGDPFEERDPGGRRQVREALAPPRLVPGHEERDVFDRVEEEPDLKALGAGQRREVSVHRVSEPCFDPRERHRPAGRKEHLGDRVDEGRFAAVEDREPSGRGRVAGEPSSMDENREPCDEHDEKETREHASTIPEGGLGSKRSTLDAPEMRMKRGRSAWFSRRSGRRRPVRDQTGSVRPCTQA